MKLPVMTRALALRLERSRADYIESWLEVMREQPGNPYGVEIGRFGPARAFVACGLPELALFNRVLGLASGQEEDVGKIRRFYHDHGVEDYRIDINPYHADPRILKELAIQGLSQSLFQTYLYGIPTVTKRSYDATPSMKVREIMASEVEIFADLHIEAFREALAQLPEETVQAYHDCTMLLYRHPGWHLSLALLDNVPIGIGMLYMRDGVASLAGGATHADFRHRGSQTATLEHRLTVAVHAQCTLVVGQASVGSTSQHNMERVGMCTAYTETTWTPFPSF